MREALGRLGRSEAARFGAVALLCLAAMAIDYWVAAAGAALIFAPEAGIALGALTVFGRRFWLAVALASIAASSIFAPATPFPVRFVMGLSEALAALGGAFVLRRLGGSGKPVAILAAAVVAILLDSLGETAVHGLSGVAPGLVEGDASLFTPLIREGLGMAAGLPLLLAWSRAPREPWTRVRLAHFAAMALVTSAIGAQVMFGENTGPFAWMIFPLLVWSALAFGLHGGTFSILLLATLATIGTALGHGPLAFRGAEDAVLLSQALLAVCIATVLVLAAATDARRNDPRLREAEARVREGESQFALFLEYAPTAIAVFDREMRYIGASRRYIRDYGLPSGIRLKGRSHYEVFPDIPERWREIHQRALAGEELTEPEDRFPRADGRTDYVRWSLRPWRDETGAVGGLILFSEVVTEAAEARNRIVAAEARYRAVFEHATVGIVRAAHDGIYLEVNDRFCEILGAPREAILGRSFADFTHDEHFPADNAAVRDMIAGARRSYTTEKRLVRPNGEIVWVMVASMLVRDAAGAPDQFIGVFEDITDRKRAEAALRESEARLRLAQEAAGVGVWEIDLEDGAAIHSPVSQRMNGLPERADGRYAADELLAHFGAELSAEVAANLASAEPGATYDSTYRLVLSDGIVRWIRAIGRHDAGNGGRGRLLGVSIDVTAFHAAQADLIGAHEKLLRVSRLSAMGAMASTLAHELNQPLSAATNYAEAGRQILRARNETADVPALGMLDGAITQALRAGEIIRKMRAFTVTGEIEPSHERIDMLVADACAAAEERARAAGVTITADVDTGVGEVMIERIQIEQVLANLLRNAVEALQGCPERHIALTVRCRPHDVLIRVADTGPGIAPDALAHLFEPFRSSKENGLGLGLSICRTIVEAHGGRLWAESPPGSGAVFSLTLPRALEEVAA